MKKVLVSMRVTEAPSYVERRNSIAYEYIEFFERLGYLVILIPNNTSDIEKYFDEETELIVLSGGNNVDPKLYQGERNLSDVYPERDEAERKLVNFGVKRKIKILGICRGFQALNVFLGGTVNHRVKDHVNKCHTIRSGLNYLNNQKTNSFHDHGIEIKDFILRV